MGLPITFNDGWILEYPFISIVISKECKKSLQWMSASENGHLTLSMILNLMGYMSINTETEFSNFIKGFTI